MDLSGDTATCLYSIVSNSYYGMLRDKLVFAITAQFFARSLANFYCQ